MVPAQKAEFAVCVCSSEWQELSLWAPAHSLHTITTQLYTQTVDWQVFLPLQIPTEMAPLPLTAEAPIIDYKP